MNTSTRRQPTPDALSWLNASQHGASLVVTAQRMLALQNNVQQLLPEHLATTCQVLKWQDGSLLVGIPSAAHSAKLRQVVPRLVQGLQQAGWQVNEIRVKVQARRDTDVALAYRNVKAPEVDATGLAAFAELHQALPEGDPVRMAVERLLRRRQASAHS